MFPRVEIFVIHGSPVDMLEKPAMDGDNSLLIKLSHTVKYSCYICNKLIKVHHLNHCQIMKICDHFNLLQGTFHILGDLTNSLSSANNSRMMSDI